MENLKRIEPGQEREKRGEFLLHLISLAREIDGFEGKTAEEIFDAGNEDGRRKLLETLSGEEYRQMITGINGILRGKGKEEWDMDGNGVSLTFEGGVSGHVFPHDKDKKEIIDKSWEGARIMNTENRDLEDIGILLGSMLVETHPFADGNGRTSRLVYLMVKNGYSKDMEQQLQEVLGEFGREEVDTALDKRYINALFEEKYGRSNEEVNQYNIAGIFPNQDGDAFASLEFPSTVGDETKEAIIQGGRTDYRVFTAAVFRFLGSHPEINVDDCIKVFGERRIFLLQNLLSQINKEKTEELATNYWDIKKQYTEDMIDIFVHPDKPEYKVEHEGKEMRMADFFKERIRQKEMLIP